MSLRRLLRRATGLDRRLTEALTLPIGQITLAEARFLGRLVAGLTDPGPIVEIGTLFGWSTRVMCLFKEPTRELITVDNFGWNPLGMTAEAHACATTTSLADAVRDHRVRLVRQGKADFYAGWSGPPPALAFLDAIHSYEETAADIAWARRAGAGRICLHDYAPAFPGVVRAVDEAGGPAELVGSLALLR